MRGYGAGRVRAVVWDVVREVVWVRKVVWEVAWVVWMCMVQSSLANGHLRRQRWSAGQPCAQRCMRCVRTQRKRRLCVSKACRIPMLLCWRWRSRELA